MQPQKQSLTNDSSDQVFSFARIANIGLLGCGRYEGGFTASGLRWQNTHLRKAGWR